MSDDQQDFDGIHRDGDPSHSPRSTPESDDDDATTIRSRHGASRPEGETHLMNKWGRAAFIVLAIVLIGVGTSLAASRIGSPLVWLIGGPLMLVAVLVGALGRSAAFTVASTILPGLGLLGARSRWARVLGVVFPAALLIAIAWAGFSASSDLGNFAGFVVNPSELSGLTAGAIAAGLVWVSLIAVTHLLTRPKGWGWGRRALGAVLVASLSFSVAGSAALAARYAYDQKKLVSTIFAQEDEVQSTSRPTIDGKKKDPWKNTPRLNIMLLGADSADARDPDEGLRADTIMVASIDTASGATTIIQIPRNVQYTPFPEGSELDEQFPRGFRGDGDPQSFFINSLWNTVENWYPDMFEGQTFRGAEGMKLGVEGITGLKVDYFALLNIDGVQRLIDAMGGVDVNINERLPIGGDTKGRKPSGYLKPGPDQHLNGYDAMWYARSRRDGTDYERMARQSCLVDAIIKQANPMTMLSSYEAIASASADMVKTDIPQQVLEPMVGLSLKVKDAKITRLVFSPGKNGYDYNDPDFDSMREAVQDAITQPVVSTDVAPEPTDTPTEEESVTPSETAPEVSASPDPVLVDGAQQVEDACAYNPIDPDEEDGEDEEG